MLVAINSLEGAHTHKHVCTKAQASRLKPNVSGVINDFSLMNSTPQNFLHNTVLNNYKGAKI